MVSSRKTKHAVASQVVDSEVDPAILVRVGPVPVHQSQNLTGEQLVDLVARAKAGDKSGWEGLVVGLSRAVYRGLASYHFPTDVRDELFQETFVKLIENLSKIDDPRALPKWLMVCADNVAKTFLRRNGRSEPVAIVPERSQPSGVDTNVLIDETRRAVYRGLLRLSPVCQDLLRLVAVDPPLTYAEIAAVLGRTHGDIGPTRQRCLEKLRRTPEVAALIGSVELGSHSDGK